MPALELLPLAYREFRRYLLPLVAIFAVIALFFLAWGVVNPPTYKSSATVLVQDNTPVTTALEGRAAAPNDAAKVMITREVLFGRRVMEDILEAGGWLEDDPSPLQKERMINGIIGRTDVVVTERGQVRSTDPKLSLVKITYSDSDAKRAHAVAKRFSEALIEQVLDSKAKASESAYQFIDAQVAKYQQSLAEADRKLRAYRTANPDALPGMDTDAAARIGELRRAVDAATMDLADVGAQEGAVMSALSREGPVSTVSRATQANMQIAGLQAELDRMRLSYTDQHPDVARLRAQIRDAQAQARSGGGGATVLPGATAQLNPVHQQLRAQLAEVRRQGAAAASRVATAQALLREELEHSQEMLATQGEVASLTRAQDVNREMYEDLLARRENARVTMSLDSDGESLGFQIQEPASMPLQSTGLRLAHFAMAGIVLAIAVPLLLLSVLVRHDPRVRSPLQIEHAGGLPVLGTIPLYVSHHQVEERGRRSRLAVMLFAGVIATYVLVYVLRVADIL
jgi:polysaccharide chain length determinant protein (PEP-CTERM system associated)